MASFSFRLMSSTQPSCWVEKPVALIREPYIRLELYEIANKLFTKLIGTTEFDRSVQLKFSVPMATFCNRRGAPEVLLPLHNVRADPRDGSRRPTIECAGS